MTVMSHYVHYVLFPSSRTGGSDSYAHEWAIIASKWIEEIKAPADKSAVD